MNELEWLRQEAEALKNAIRVCFAVIMPSKCLISDLGDISPIPEPTIKTYSTILTH